MLQDNLLLPRALLWEKNWPSSWVMIRARDRRMASNLRARGTYIEKGVSLRSSFIIDPDGVLRAMEMHDNRARDHRIWPRKGRAR